MGDQVNSGPHLIDTNSSYDEFVPGPPIIPGSPKNKYNFVGWANLFEVFRRVVVAIASTPGLSLREFDLTNELLLTRFPVQARLIYDNTRNVDVFAAVQDLVANAGFDRKLVTFSVFEANTTIPDFDCLSVYDDSARVMAMSALFAGLRGGSIGLPANLPNPQTQGYLWCYGGYTEMVLVPGARQVPSIADMHATPCAMVEATGRCDPYHDVNAIKTEARRTFNGVADLLQSYCVGGWREEKIPDLCSATFIQGEVAAKKEPPVNNIRPDGLPSNCDGSPPNAPEGSARGFNESGLAGRSAVIRPWLDNMNAPDNGVVCYESPHNVRRTFGPQP